MAVYKDNKTNTWRVVYRIPDWKGGTKQSQKRGFSTKREALAWEREFLNKAHTPVDSDAGKEAVEMLNEYMKRFQERNPNLRVSSTMPKIPKQRSIPMIQS